MNIDRIDLSGNFSSQTKEELFTLFQTSPQGLSPPIAQERLGIYGTNEFAREKKKTLVRKIFEALIEPMALILIIAAFLSFFIINDALEAVAIVAVVIINTIIGLIQEGKAEKAAEELKKILSPQCKVIRDGNVDVIASKFLVPGDVIVFESGDIIPSDARLIEATDLLVDEAHLTGESEPIQKTIQSIPEKNLKLYEMKNIVFAGSKVLNGHAKALVVKTGNLTEIGKIAVNIQETEEERTPLQKKMDREVKWLVILAIVALVLVLVMGYLPWYRPWVFNFTWDKHIGCGIS
jgi:P-type Ca2+ transporter type 2C